MDAPEHTRYRRMLTAEFTARRIRTLRPLVADLADTLLDTMAAGPPRADLVQTFALPLPSMVICHLLGVPYADHGFFQEHSAAMLDTRAEPEHARNAEQTLGRYLQTLVTAKESDPGGDLISRLIADRLRTGELTHREVTGMAMLLLVAGHETTANMIALGTLMLLQHPEQAREIQETSDPAVADRTVEELLRLLTVTHLGRRRVATEDVTISGVQIRAGDGVIAAAETANRDPAAFECPDALDIHRPGNHHVAFGFGPHQCLGQSLARLELQVAYPALLRRFPRLALDGDIGQLRFRDEMPVYGVDALPVRW